MHIDGDNEGMYERCDLKAHLRTQLWRRPATRWIADCASCVPAGDQSWSGPVSRIQQILPGGGRAETFRNACTARIPRSTSAPGGGLQMSRQQQFQLKRARPPADSFPTPFGCAGEPRRRTHAPQPARCVANHGRIFSLLKRSINGCGAIAIAAWAWMAASLEPTAQRPTDRSPVDRWPRSQSPD